MNGPDSTIAVPPRQDDRARLAAYTWRLQWPAEMGKGVVEGIIGLASFVAMRSLGAPDWVAVFLTVAGQALWIFSPGLEIFVVRFDPRRAIWWLGVAANVPLLLIAFVEVERHAARYDSAAAPAAGTPWWILFIGALVIVSALDALYIPLRGGLVRANYSDALRGRYFGWMSAASRTASIAAAKCSGFLLDHDPRWLRVLFPVAGIAGLYEHWQLSRIRWHHRDQHRSAGNGTSFFALLRDGWRILAEDRDFRIYEIGFSLYGLGFLLSQPLFAVFAEKHLRLSYGELTWAQGVAEPVAYLAVALIVGPRLQRIGVVLLTAVSFLCLSVFFVLLAFVETPTQYACLWVLFGATMAAVNLGWNLGPLRFAPAGRARSYSAVHLCVVGVRIVIAPALGYLLHRWAGPRVVFGMSSALVAAGAVTTSLLARRIR